MRRSDPGANVMVTRRRQGKGSPGKRPAVVVHRRVRRRGGTRVGRTVGAVHAGCRGFMVPVMVRPLGSTPDRPPTVASVATEGRRISGVRMAVGARQCGRSGVSFRTGTDGGPRTDFPPPPPGGVGCVGVAASPPSTHCGSSRMVSGSATQAPSRNTTRLWSLWAVSAKKATGSPRHFRPQHRPVVRRGRPSPLQGPKSPAVPQRWLQRHPGRACRANDAAGSTDLGSWPAPY